VLKGINKICFNRTGIADEVGIPETGLAPGKEVSAGDVGYIIAGIKNAKEVKVGDTITLSSNPNPQ
jgi:GTP-binding protein LepA